MIIQLQELWGRSGTDVEEGEKVWASAGTPGHFKGVQ